MVLVVVEIGTQPTWMIMDMVSPCEVSSCASSVSGADIHRCAYRKRIGSANQMPGGVVLGMVRRSIANGCMVGAGKSRMMLVGSNAA